MTTNENPGNFRNRDKADVRFTAAQGGMGAKGGTGGPDYTYDTAQDEYEGPKVVPDDEPAEALRERADDAFKPATELVGAGAGSGKQITDAKGGIGVPAVNAAGQSGATDDQGATLPEEGGGAGVSAQEVREADADEREVVMRGKQELKENPTTTLRSGKEIDL